MPAIQPEEIVDAILAAIQESGFSGVLISKARVHPRRFSVVAPDGYQTILSVYVWTLTFGGRKSLPNEYRIQMTSVQSPLQIAKDGPTVKDRFGQLQQHPCVRTLAVEHGIFLRTLKQLGLDIEQIGQGRPGRPDGWQPS